MKGKPAIYIDSHIQAGHEPMVRPVRLQTTLKLKRWSRAGDQVNTRAWGWARISEDGSRLSRRGDFWVETLLDTLLGPFVGLFYTYMYTRIKNKLERFVRTLGSLWFEATNCPSDKDGYVQEYSREWIIVVVHRTYHDCLTRQYCESVNHKR